MGADTTYEKLKAEIEREVCREIATALVPGAKAETLDGVFAALYRAQSAWLQAGRPETVDNRAYKRGRELALYDAAAARRQAFQEVAQALDPTAKCETVDGVVRLVADLRKRSSEGMRQHCETMNLREVNKAYARGVRRGREVTCAEIMDALDIDADAPLHAQTVIDTVKAERAARVPDAPAFKVGDLVLSKQSRVCYRVLKMDGGWLYTLPAEREGNRHSHVFRADELEPAGDGL